MTPSTRNQINDKAGLGFLPSAYAVCARYKAKARSAFTPPKKQIVKNGSTVLIHASDLPIEHSVRDAQILADPLSKMLEIVKCVFVPRQEITLAVLDEGERPEPVDLQLEDEIVGVEGCGTAREPHGVEVSRQVDSHHAEYTKYLCFCMSVACVDA